MRIAHYRITWTGTDPEVTHLRSMLVWPNGIISHCDGDTALEPLRTRKDVRELVLASLSLELPLMKDEEVVISGPRRSPSLIASGIGRQDKGEIYCTMCVLEPGADICIHCQVKASSCARRRIVWDGSTIRVENA